MTALNSFVDNLSRFLALLGGFVLLFVILVICLSVLGRFLGDLGHADFVTATLPFLSDFLTFFGPLDGDYELVEACIAFSIFLFLPWCHLSGGHARVDALTSLFSNFWNRFFVFLWDLLFALFFVLVSWRLFFGLSDKFRYGETTFLLQFPLWVPYLLCFLCSLLCIFVYFFIFVARVREFLVRNTDTVSGSGGYIS